MIVEAARAVIQASNLREPLPLLAAAQNTSGEIAILRRGSREEEILAICTELQVRLPLALTNGKRSLPTPLPVLASI